MEAEGLALSEGYQEPEQAGPPPENIAPPRLSPGDLKPPEPPEWSDDQLVTDRSED